MKKEIIKDFKVGDLVCSKKNFDNGLFLFFKATQEDVLEYSGKNEYYKIESAESSRNEKTYRLTKEELELFGEYCNNYSSGIFDINQEECYGYNIVDQWLKDNNK